MSLQPARQDRDGIAPDLLQRLRKRLADSPALGWLSPTLEELALDSCVLRLPYREAITNGSGTTGVRTHVFSAPVSTALVSGNTITITHLSLIHI